MKKRKPQSPKPAVREIRIEELEQILERVREVLSPEEHDKLRGALQTLARLQQELEAKGASIQRLRHLLFGPSTEKTSRILGKNSAQSQDAASQASSGTASSGASREPQDRTEAVEPERGKREGHGRNAAREYLGAAKVPVAHPQLHHKDRCPLCEKGKLYVQLEPSPLVRVVGMAPLVATVYERERLRCNLCGELYTAPCPPGVGEEKYDESVSSMLGLLKYGCGLPFHRLEWLEEQLGIPFPQSTQWELVHDAAALLEPAYAELIARAAQGEVLHNDDTTMKILQLQRPAQGEGPSATDAASERTGTFTTGIVSTREGQRIALFFTGHKHAGENLQDVLEHRAAELGTAIQMCDALSRNTSGSFKTIVANCLAHGRRRFVDVAHSFPDECRHVLEALGQVYRNDAQAKDQGLSPQERLVLHQQRSAPVMDELHKWLQGQLEDKKVEPNSGLGKAIGYMLRHWPKLTLFLRQAGAPLDNNICEQALKKAILHRKNSLFYKTENGAKVGDLFMSLIHTAELCGANPFDYLMALQRHHQALLDEPAAWMPWSYEQTLKQLDASIPEPMPP